MNRFVTIITAVFLVCNLANAGISHTQEDNQNYRGIVIIDSTQPNAYFGMYRFSQMTEPGWDMLGRTIDWAIDHRDHDATRIWFTANNGLLDPEYGNIDAISAYDYMVNTMGFNPDSIHVALWSSIDTADFTGYHLVFHSSTIYKDPTNVMDQDIPLITICHGQTTKMEISTSELTFHESRDFAFIQDNEHYITSTYEQGQFFLEQNMWINAIYPSGNGQALITADISYYYPPATVKIEKAHNVAMGSPITVPISLINVPSWFEMGGFDFLLTYDPAILSVIGVSSGELLDSCQWEYFTYRTDSASCGGSPCSEGTIRIVAVADLSGDQQTPSCFADSSGTLAEINFHVYMSTNYECTFVPVRFIWYDCGDNCLASVTGDSLFISNEVYDYGVIPITHDTTFPTHCGAPSECVVDQVFRRINFLNGGVDILCADSIDARGDINLNGISYEIADAILFANYFLWGSDVFTVNLHEQIAVSDVNNDGVPLSLDDYAYFWRVITGDAMPYPGISRQTDTVLFSQDTENKTVSLSYTDSLSAVFLIFEGDLMPWGWEDSTRPFDGVYTRVLMDIWGWNDSTIFYQDSLLFYTGEGTLVGAYAAYDGLTSIPTAIEDGVTSCCLNRGNVDGDPDGSLNVADLVYLVLYTFQSGPEPPCLDEADIRADWSIDIVDIIFLVNFMFNGGPPPMPCP